MIKKKHLYFCTLFDSYYMDKGLTMYESLERYTDAYTLFIFAFDERSYVYLKSLNLENVIVIPENDILNDSLCVLKQKRTRAEYCWTCTPIVIDYVLNILNCDNCTYLDSDIYFFNNPRILIDEMLKEGKEILITPHWFRRSFENYLIEKMYGRFCVQFNTFLATSESQRVLKWWRESCEKECTVKSKWKTYGDQKYQDSFCKISPKVYELNYYGGGIAPWNIGNYKLKHIEECGIVVKNSTNMKEYFVVFYHFQGLREIENKIYDLNVHKWQGNNVDEELVYTLYGEYINHLNRIRKQLKQANLVVLSETVNKEIKHSKNTKRFECGLFKQLIMSIVGMLEFSRKNKYAELDLREFEENTEDRKWREKNVYQ